MVIGDAIVNKVVTLTIPTLQEHLTECEERYQDVVQRLDKMDTKVDRIEQLVLDIKNSLKGPDHDYQ
jgi:tetrahydromethanopterin S-methyltransferase subunit B